jgi:hypothetical protein
VSFRKKPLTEIINDFFNESATAIDNFLDNATIATQASIGELYRRGHIDFHIHFSWSRICLGEIKSENFCAIFSCLPIVIGDYIGKPLPGRESSLERGSFEFLRYDNEQAMFVDDVQLREQPEESGLRWIRSLIRLRVLDCCKRFSANEWGNKALCLGLEITRGEANGKARLGRFSLGSSLFEQGKLEYKMVENGSKVMDTVSHDQRQSWIERLHFWEPQRNGLPIFVNFMGGGNIISARFRANCGFDSRVEIDEVSLCSVELGSHSFQRRTGQD